VANLDGARIIHPPGASAAPISRHYLDMADDRQAGRAVPLHISDAAWDHATTEILAVTP
jgi:acyl-homoserine lactone acylase PvdQ